ncbi:hypothetical protein VTO73DRAFT_2095 [Trametes versicolor]
MPFKRPAHNPTKSEGSASGSSSSSNSPPPAKRSKASVTKSLPEINVYLVQAKLDAGAIAELLTLGERHTKGLCENAADADVIITAISMRRRFERHVPWDIATSKAVVTPQWLRDSIEHGSALPCGDYVAIEDLHETTVKNCPDCNCKPCACADSSASALSPSSSPRRPAAHGPGHLPSPPTSPCTSRHDASGQAAPIPAHLLPPDPPNVTDLEKLNYMSLYACQRVSPLVCPNQDLARELDVIRQSRALEGEDRSALSYQRAISVIKAYPEKIRSLKQVQKLPYIGVKISGLVDEFLDNGHISEAQTIQSSERFRTLSLFTSIYGIGPHAARRLFALGLRSLADLEIYHGVEPSSSSSSSPTSHIVEVEEKPRQTGWKGRDGDRGKGDEEGLGDSWIRVALGLREDLSEMIPRDEVEEIGRVVMRELDALEPGCVSTIVGGYRRGKPESNDVDIVFTHPDAGKVKGLCKRFVRHLHARGMVTHVMHLSNFHAHDPLRTAHWDTLEKSLTVFVLPPSSALNSSVPVRRRLDLIFAPPEVYWTAVVGCHDCAPLPAYLTPRHAASHIVGRSPSARMRSLGLESTVLTSSRAHAASWASDNATPGTMHQDGRAPQLAARTEQKLFTSFRSISWVDWTTKRRNRPLRVGPAPSSRTAAPAHSAAPGTSPTPLAGMCEDVARRGRRGAEAGGRLRENRRGSSSTIPAVPRTHRLLRLRSSVHAFADASVVASAACKTAQRLRHAAGRCHAGPVPSPARPNGSPQAPKNKTAGLRDHDAHALHSAPRSEQKEN